MSFWDFQISWSGSWGSLESAGLLRWNIQMWRWHWPHEGPDTILDEAKQGHWVKKWSFFDSPNRGTINIYGLTLFMIYQIYSPSLWLHAMYMICTWSLGVSLKIGCHPGGIPNQHWSRWLILRTSMGLSQIGDENPQLMSISLRIFAQNHQHKNIKFKGGFSHSFHAKPNIPTL